MRKTKGFDEDVTRQGEGTDLADVVEKRMEILLKEAANTPMDLEWVKPELPPFFDEKKFNLGQQMFSNNCFTMMIGKLAGLLSLMAIPTIADILIFTKQSSTICNAFRRYVSTVLHTWVWYRKEPGIEHQFWDSLKIVRKKHCVAFKKSVDSGVHWATQFDMALTQFGFIGYTLMCGDYLGVSATYEEVEGLIHLWRVIGSMLGMEDRFNLCSGTVEETRALCRRLLEEVFLPSFRKDNENFVTLSRTLVEGLWPMNPQLDPDAFMMITMQLASSAATNNNHSIEIDTSTMSAYSRFTYNLQRCVHECLLQTKHWWSPIFRGFFNATMRLSVYLTEHFPFLAFGIYGWKNSYVDIFAYRVN